MTAYSLTLPLDRVSPVRIPIRDIVLGGTDSLTLTVSIVDRDSSDAAPIEVTGGIGGPAVTMFVWPDGHERGYGGWNGWGGCQDYGWGWYGGGTAPAPIWTGVGGIADAASAAFAILIPAGTMTAWPLRSRWAIYFDADGGGTAELLAEGRLHVRPMVSRGITPVIMLTDPNPAVLTDPVTGVIYLGGAPAPSSSSGPAGGLPVASTTTLGGITVDGVNTRTDPATGLLTTTARLG